jgi:hypothetical protein
MEEKTATISINGRQYVLHDIWDDMAPEDVLDFEQCKNMPLPELVAAMKTVNEFLGGDPYGGGRSIQGVYISHRWLDQLMVCYIGDEQVADLFNSSYRWYG